MAEIFQLDLYDDAGTTIVASFSTDPAHARPYLLPPENLATQEIAFAEGRASIGGCNVEIVDVPITPGDQDTGYLTSLLSETVGRRARLRAWIAAAWENVIDGVLADQTLHESYSSFTLSLKDQRENERRISAFTRARTASILPAGVIDGFGFNPTTGQWLVAPTEPIVATYTEPTVGGVPYSYLDFPHRDDLVPLWQVVTPAMLAALESQEPGAVRLYWRNVGGGAFNEVEVTYRSTDRSFRVYVGGGMRGGHVSRVSKLDFPPGRFKDPDGNEVDVTYIDSFAFIWPSGVVPKPTVSTNIEVIFGYGGAPSDDYPLHLDGLTFGEVLQNLYDGVYSEPGSLPAIQYDSATVLALTDPFRGRITEPLDDEDGIWKWTEENIYAITGSAPTLDSQGRISPAKYELPPDGASLLQLDDSICQPSPGWSHGDTDVINSVSVEYTRIFAVPLDWDPLGKLAAGDGLVEKKLEVQLTAEHLPELATSVAIFGERWLKLKSVGLTAIGGVDGQPVTGDVTDELGTQIAAKRAREAVDRFLYGGQHFTVMVARSALESRGVGTWCIVACSWMPNYATGERGANNLAQIMRVTPLDSTWSEVALIDAGPNNTPIGVATLGAVTANSEGVVSIPVTAVPAGGDARVDYAINATEPAADSPLWLFVARVSAATTITTPPAPAGSTVWVRARGEKEGRRPSAWTAAVSVAVPQTPRVSGVRVVVDQTAGSVIVTWIPNAYALGVRLHYDAHDPLVDPTFATIDKDASLGTHTFAAGTVGSGEMFTVDAEPYPGWTGSAVSGAAGVKVRASGLRDVTGFDAAMAEVVSMTLTEPEAYYLKGSLALTNTTRWAAYEKLGAWPTLDETQAGIVDTAYLRHEGQFKSIWGHSVEAGTWHVIVVPFNVNLQAGTRAEGSITIVGLATVEGVLLTLEAAQFPTYNKLLWTMNDAVDDAGARYEVDVYRDDDLLEAGRNARTDDDGTTPGTADAGGYRDTGPQECVTEELCFFQTFVYTVVLKDSTTVYDDKIYTVNLDGLWAG